MKKFIENIIYTILGFTRIMGNIVHFPDIARLKKDGGFCYILGNGPSLNKDLEGKTDNLEKQTIFAVNYFVNSDLFQKFEPAYYVLADPAFFTSDTTDYRHPLVLKMIEALLSKTTWKMILIVPRKGSEFIQNSLKSNANITVVNYNIEGVRKGFKWFNHWIHNKQWATYGATNVINATAYLAVYLGFKEVNLLGVDHSWHIDFIVGDDNLIYQCDKHFYDTSTPMLTLTVTDPGRDEPLKLHELLSCSATALETYHHIEEYAQHKGTKIYNLCTNSFIDAFERKRL